MRYTQSLIVSVQDIRTPEHLRKNLNECVARRSARSPGSCLRRFSPAFLKFLLFSKVQKAPFVAKKPKAVVVGFQRIREKGRYLPSCHDGQDPAVLEPLFEPLDARCGHITRKPESCHSFRVSADLFRTFSKSVFDQDMRIQRAVSCCTVSRNCPQSRPHFVRPFGVFFKKNK